GNRNYFSSNVALNIQYNVYDDNGNLVLDSDGNPVHEDLVINRLEDSDAENTFTDNSGKNHQVNEIPYYENNFNYVNGTNILNDNEIFLIESVNSDIPVEKGEDLEISYTLPRGTINNYNDSSPSSNSAPNTSNRSNTDFSSTHSSLNIVDFGTTAQYSTNAKSTAFNLNGQTFTYPSDSGDVLIGYVNEKTFDEILVEFINKSVASFSGTDNYEMIKYFQQEEIFTINYGIVFDDIYNDSFVNENNFFSFENKIEEKSNDLNIFLNDYLTWDDVFVQISSGGIRYKWDTVKDSNFVARKTSYGWYDMDYFPNKSLATSYESYTNYNNISQLINYSIIAVSLIVVAIILIKKVRDSQKELGSLKALGFSPTAIAISYVIYPAIALSIGFLIGVGLSFLISGTWLTIFTSTYSVGLFVQPHSILSIMLILINILVIYTVFSFIVTRVLLSKNSLYLLKETSTLKANKLIKSLDKNTENFSNKYFNFMFGIKSSLRSSKKLVFMFFTIGGTTLFILFAMSSTKAISTSVDKSFESVTFQYLEFNSKFSKPSYAEMSNSKYITNEEFLSNLDVISVPSPSDYTSEATDRDNYINYSAQFISDVYSHELNKNGYSALSKESAAEFVKWTKDVITKEAGTIPSTKYRNLQADVELNPNFPTLSTSTDRDLLLNITNALDDATSLSNSNVEYISFGYSTYNPSNQSPAILNMSSYYIDTDGDNTVIDPGTGNLNNEEKVGSSLTIIGDPTSLSKSISMEGDSGENSLVTELIPNPDIYIDIDNDNVDEVFANAVVDQLTADIYNIEEGDIIYINYPNSTFNSSSSSYIPVVPVYVSEVSFSAVPFGIITSNQSSYFTSMHENASKNEDFYNFANMTTVIDSSVITSISTSINSLNGTTPAIGTPPSIQSGTNFIDFVNEHNDIIEANYLISGQNISGDTDNPNALPSAVNIDLAKSLAQEAVDRILVVVPILVLSITFISVVLILISIFDAIDATRRESTVMQAMGYSPHRIARINTVGFFILYMIAFLLSIPISIAFVSIFNTSVSFVSAGAVFLSITVGEILLMLIWTLLIYLITYVSAVVIYSNQKVTTALVKT
ncbi:MAG: ABC transporter permease, partial [Mycoplasmataceae bacterium]|nr:ABC transporter permease [Mycoplasmataceae bacterium]